MLGQACPNLGAVSARVSVLLSMGFHGWCAYNNRKGRARLPAMAEYDRPLQHTFSGPKRRRGHLTHELTSPLRAPPAILPRLRLTLTSPAACLAALDGLPSNPLAAGLSRKPDDAARVAVVVLPLPPLCVHMRRGQVHSQRGKQQ